MELNLQQNGSDDNACFQVLSESLRSENPISPAAAAHRIDELKPTQAEDPDIESFLWEVWRTFIHVAQQIPHNHPAQDTLVQILQALVERPQTTITLWDAQTRLWKDLPLLGPSLREAWISPGSDAKPVSQEAADQWRNLNSFAARVLRSSLETWPNFAIWSLREALEQDNPDSTILNSRVAAATEWIVHGNEVLTQMIQTGDYGDEQPATRGGPNYDGPGGLCLERWRFWQQQLDELSGELEGEIRDVVSDVVNLM